MNNKSIERKLEQNFFFWQIDSTLSCRLIPFSYLHHGGDLIISRLRLMTWRQCLDLMMG